MTKSVVRVEGGVGEQEIEAVDPEKVLSGEPVATSENLYANEGESFFSGIWSSTEGKWRISYSEEEFCILLSGKVALTDADGRTETFKAGDAFVSPAGFEGAWETLEPVRKLYAIAG